MDIGKITDNDTFYAGYEGETEIILSIPNSDTIHIWEGYFDDIFDTPSLDGNGWKGFTRDFHQMEGAFADDNPKTDMNVIEYFEDLVQYKNKTFDYDETAQVFELMMSLFKKAIEIDAPIIMKVV